ncbi:MAG: Osmosensitive channel histidine kinase KdpD [Myxococcaceae bacterium]|nr:Osmosensitive channel histidine kinase KdpD [Myxococcaceae bacterium]
MRLFTRLLISHWIPPLILTLALGLALTALLRVGLVLSTLNESELETLRDEGALHRAAWGLDVEMRHALISCRRGDPPSEIRRVVSARAGALRSVFHEAPRLPLPMREVVEGYLTAASKALAGDACEGLHEAELRMRVAQLDERLTDLWVERLGELHRAVSKKENDARQIAVTAAWMGIPLAIASFVLAMWMARQMAEVLEDPLVKLAQAAQRVGRGDFDTPTSVVAGPPEILALAEDLERMRLELQQLETLKQGFLASVSHELRTPLSKIREGLALLADGALGPLDERQLRVVQIARTACEREIRMVITLLDLSRLRAGSPIYMHESASIDGVISAAIEGERVDAQQRGVTIELDARGDSGNCRLDPALMERAIANVVRNAVAVSARGQTVGVERTIEPGVGGRHERVVRIRVRDHGPGVPDEIRSKLFDAFVTRPVPNSGKTFGSGIGLALAREVARAHGGDLLLRDGSSATHGPGAIFELWVPIEGKAQPSALAPRSLGLDSPL